MKLERIQDLDNTFIQDAQSNIFVPFCRLQFSKHTELFK